MKKSNRNDENFNPKKVIFNGRVFETGNRYHTLIELYIDKKFMQTVEMKDVEPISDFQIKVRTKFESFKKLFKP